MLHRKLKYVMRQREGGEVELSFHPLGSAVKAQREQQAQSSRGSAVGRHIRKPAWLQWSMGTDVKPASPQGLDARTFERCYPRLKERKN